MFKFLRGLDLTSGFSSLKLVVKKKPRSVSSNFIRVFDLESFTKLKTNRQTAVRCFLTTMDEDF